MNSKLLPTVLVVIDVASAAVYAGHADWRRVIYWLAAAVLTASVTY